MTGFTSKILLVAIGSSHGDDKAAWEVAELLATRLTVKSVIKKASVPINLIDWLEDIHELHIVDACNGGGRPGELLRFEWGIDHPKFPALWKSGTHDFDVLSVLELARTLKRLPERVIIWGIVGTKFEPSGDLSSEIQSRLAAIANTIGKEVADAREVSGAVAADAG